MFQSGSRKYSGFSSKNKIQQHHGDGTQTIICMGRPFRVEKRLNASNLGFGRRRSKNRDEGNSFVYLVENSSRLSEFPMYLVLKRVFFSVDQITDAHKEIGILTSIKDKNIVRVFHNEIARSEGKISVTIAMEYCDNNLARRIASGAGGGAGPRLSEAEICHVLFAITSALGYLHSLQPPIAHRNITPDNILINNNLTGPWAYMLTNFESASTEAYECANREEAALATEDIEKHTHPAFRAPEMADPWSKRRICEKSDMWMLGVLLYYLIYLRLPFEATNMALSRDPKPSFPVTAATSAYTGSLRTILEHLLEPNPETRWDVFALTNFLRFDDDVNRHLGTFCFTRTEFPAEWEEQDIRVVNRAAPRKAPPIVYSEDGHATVRQQRLEQRSDLGQITTESYIDDLVQEVMLVTGDGGGMGDLNSAERAQYREMIIREQTEAWERAKNATATPAPAPEAPAKNNFDDLFVGPVETGPDPSTATASAPQPDVSVSVSQVKDPFGSDGIFSVPPPQALAEPPLFSHPQPAWESMSGFAPINNHNPVGFGFPSFAAQPQGMQPLIQQGSQNGAYGVDSSNIYVPGGCHASGGEFRPQPQPPQSQNVSSLLPQMNVDFLSLPPNQYQPQQPVETASNQQNNPAQKGKKDPFADLLL